MATKNPMSKTPRTTPRQRRPAGGPAGTPDEVRFYRADEKPFGALSNLFPRPFLFEGRTFPTAEHAYQAGKPRRGHVREWLLSAPSPSLVAMAAHALFTWEVTPDWSKIKFGRMKAVLRAKFTQHPDLAELLISTGGARIVEAGRTSNAVNRTWGEVNGVGQNMLGVLLMELRAELAGARGRRRRRGTAERRAAPAAPAASARGRARRGRGPSGV